MMRCTNEKGRRAERGSILMETVLVLPIYVVLIGGIFWIGELILAKQKLVMADRYAAWNAGNRHRWDKAGIRPEIQNKYFNVDEVGQQNVAAILYEAWDPFKWSNPIGGTVPLTMWMPEWTKGWLAGSPAWEGVTEIPEMAVQRGRDVPGQKSQHVVFMRNLFGDYAYRSRFWKPRNLADWSMPWLDRVYLETWPKVDFLKPMSPESLLVPTTPWPPFGYQHDRHPAYIRWSY